MKITQNASAKKSKISNRLLLLVVVISMIPLFFVSRTLFTSLAQTKATSEKKFIKESYKNEPIEFSSINSNGKKIKLNEKLIQENDWLKDLTIDFKNIYDKPITYISLIINFPETHSNGLPMSYIVKFGVHPNNANKNNYASEIVLPKEVAQINLSQKSYDALKTFLATRNFTLKDLTEANLAIQTVFFADGTIWFGGTISRPDPTHPGKYIRVDENYNGGN